MNENELQLLAELKEISARNSSNERFRGGEDNENNENNVNGSNEKNDEIESQQESKDMPSPTKKSKMKLKQGRADEGDLSLPPWKQKKGISSSNERNVKDGEYHVFEKLWTFMKKKKLL